MEIAPVVTRADLEDFHAVQKAAMAHDYVGLPADPIEELLPLLEQPESAGERTELHVGGAEGVPTGMVSVRTPTMDNLEVVNADVMVHPDHRRQGYGRQLADLVLAEARRLGRTRVFIAVASWPDRPSEAGPLLARYGFKPVLDDIRRMVDLTESPAAPRGDVPDGYRMVQWIDRAPEELVDGLAYLSGRMTLDAPMGEMNYEQEKWDAGRYREKEQAAVDRRRRRIVTAAVHGSGQVAGMTDIAVSDVEPVVGYQWDTIVDPDHRGHGLGLVLKVWNHALVVETEPAVRYINTWNAATNTFMIRVNEALGFRPVETWTEHQLDL